MEHQPTNHKLEREINYSNFVLDILDKRFDIETSIADQAEFDADYSGVVAENYEAPACLDHYMPPSTELTLDIQAQRPPNGDPTINRIDLFPADSASITISCEGPLLTAEQGDELSILDGEMMDILKPLLPQQVREQATANQTLAYLGEFAPESHVTLKREVSTAEFNGVVALTKAETVDNSLHSLEVIKYSEHASGAVIGTHMRLDESIKSRMTKSNPDFTDQRLTIDAIYSNDGEISSDTVFDVLLDENNRSIEVDTATQGHIDDITKVLHATTAI